MAFTAVSAGHLHGTWDYGAKSLPIELDRMQISHDGQADQPCGDEVFSLPRFTAPVITTRLARWMGITYNRVLINPGKQFADSGSETFQLSGTTPAIRRVNADLYENCGGVHPDYGLSYGTLDLRSGTQVNLYDWFTRRL